jgi:soluble lytic murein transglycosylase-like protein
MLVVLGKPKAGPPAKYRDPQEFVESIPFTETREYVQAIMRNANVYKQLYGTPQIPAFF